MCPGPADPVRLGPQRAQAGAAARGGVPGGRRRGHQVPRAAGRV